MIFILIPIIAIGIFVIVTYNNLQTIKTRIKASIQEIGNQLKRQAGLIPNLTNSAKAFLKQEKDIFKQLTDARKIIASASKSGNLEGMEKAQDMIQSALGSLRIVVESNPEIKSSGVIENLMNELRDTADKIMYARRTLIDLSADFNRIIVTFPTNLIANAFSFKQEKGLSTATSGDHLSVSAHETKTPSVDL